MAFATSLFDQDGIQVRMMNSRVEGNGITSEPQALQLIQQIKFSGLTPLGTSLWQKILQPLVLGPAQQGRLQKPVVIISEFWCNLNRLRNEPNGIKLSLTVPLLANPRRRSSTSSFELMPNLSDLVTVPMLFHTVSIISILLLQN